jgi:hypothetical protein
VPEKASEAPQLLLSHLLYEVPPRITSEQLAGRLAIALPAAKLVSKPDQAGALLVAHENHVFEFKDGKKVPALTAVAVEDRVDSEKLKPALHQTRDWPAAQEAVGRAKHQVAVFEMMSRVFKPQARVEMFYNLLLQVIEISPPIAIYCHHSERVLDPVRIIRSSGASNTFERMCVFLNVRLFRIENGERGDTLMDTRGLAALGLPDLQMHFRSLEAGRVAKLLYDSAMYIYDHGDRIKDGHTIQGLEPQHRWRCQHEESLIAPKRLVIDIDPGDPFAAGKRGR